METQKFIEMFLRPGFNRTEAKVYLALQKGNTLKASEIVLHSGVPRQKVYDALKNFFYKGFCSYKQGKIQKYSAALLILTFLLMNTSKHKKNRNLSERLLPLIKSKILWRN